MLNTSLIDKFEKFQEILMLINEIMMMLTFHYSMLNALYSPYASVLIHAYPIPDSSPFWTYNNNNGFYLFLRQERLGTMQPLLICTTLGGAYAEAPARLRY